MRKSQFLIGAASSGSGKTTFTIGLLRALKDRGLDVQPFKCGPDYIDTKYHAIASGEESVNLDVFMAAEKRVREVYARYGEHSDVCVTEGVMGLFDGYDGMNGSSAEIAALLNIPVILLLNARSTAYSVAPVLYGFKHFYPKLQVAGSFLILSVPLCITLICNKRARMSVWKLWDTSRNRKILRCLPGIWG